MILVTGAAGFIGYHVARKLLEDGQRVAGVDIVNDYYSPQLKWDRVGELKAFPNFSFHRLDLCDTQALRELFASSEFSQVIHLAAQAGVRYSLKHPEAYQRSNLEAFLNILEMCRHHKVENLIYASSSSVYGKNTKVPFSENDRLEGQISLYGATKRANELMAHTYFHLYGLNTTGLRFFTVYGPWGRPDMAMFLFTEAILRDEQISVFNYGHMRRDFTYIDDIVEGVTACLEHKFEYEIFNLGNNKPVELLYLIELMEKKLGREANKLMLPIQPGDCEATYADINRAGRLLGFEPKTSIEEGLDRFIGWYKSYFGA